MTSPLVTADWLRDNLDNVLLFDANYHLPTVDRDSEAEFTAAHIPGAMRFDINAIADPDATLPTEGGADAPARIAAGQHAAVGQKMPPAHAAQGRELAG